MTSCTDGQEETTLQPAVPAINSASVIPELTQGPSEAM